LICSSVVLMLILSFIWESPVTPGAGWKPASTDFPIWEIFKLLTISIGLPFFLLSTNSPLMQVWFNRIYPERSPYKLYALSNVGSMVALLSYPILVEPYLTIQRQGIIWSLSYILFAALVLYGVIRNMKFKKHPNTNQVKVTAEVQIRPDKKSLVLWIMLSACASIILLAMTSFATQEVAVIPFLWVLPLSVYLFTFILAFSSERLYSRQIYLILFFVILLCFGWTLFLGPNLGIPAKLAISMTTLFICCMICHGELYRLRPSPKYLTSFYFIVSVGGALGGVLVNFVAPFIFKGYWELPLSLVFCSLLLLILMLFYKIRLRFRLLFILNNVLIICLVSISALITYLYINNMYKNTLVSYRNFYGVIRVMEKNEKEWSSPAYQLVHGITIHGVQLEEKTQRKIATAYFSKNSGVGLAILNHPDRGKGMSIGVCGLGIGTLAAYGQQGDTYRFYEINPAVIKLAQGEWDYFSFLTDSQAKIEVVQGDARISLERELAAGDKQNYDILVLDTFSSDSIPVHLLDLQAFELYLQHLQEDGILAVHISNYHLDLVPVVWNLADHFNMTRVLIEDPGKDMAAIRSVWMLLSSDPNLLNTPVITSMGSRMDNYKTNIRIWTDDYSNLFQILK
ncbi:MAG: fused MFS/spermidine synthase, partial [Thiobacillus sp.]